MSCLLLKRQEKISKDFMNSEHCVLPMTHLAQDPSCRQADIPTVIDITSQNTSFCCTKKLLHFKKNKYTTVSVNTSYY